MRVLEVYDKKNAILFIKCAHMRYICSVSEPVKNTFPPHVTSVVKSHIYKEHRFYTYMRTCDTS